MWYRLSDVQLAQSLYRDLLFRQFCRLELGGDVPEASTLGRFRTRLVEHDLWDRLLGEINRQLECELSAKINPFMDLCFNISSNILTLLDLRRPPHELADSTNNHLSNGMQTL